MLPLARSLSDAGHEVAFCAPVRFGSVVEGAGFEHIAVGADYLQSDAAAPTDNAEAISELEVKMFVESPPTVASDLVRLFEDRRPDAMIVDVIEFGAMAACEAAQVPWAALITGSRSFRSPGMLPFNPEERDRFLEQMIEAPKRTRRQAVGLSDDGLDPNERPYDRTMALLMAPPSFEVAPTPMLGHTGFRLRPEVHFSDAPPIPASIGRERPVVAISFGTLFGTVALYEAAISASLELDVDVLAATGFELGIEHERLTVVPWVSMDALMAVTDVFVHHGGWGSTANGLITGTPSVAIPLGAEQPENAFRLNSVGAGIMLERGDIPAELPGAITQILENPVYRLNAERFAREIEAMPSASEVVPLLERLVSEGPPILNR